MTAPEPIFVPADYFRETALAEIFPGAPRPLDIDLGCGDGSFLEQIAILHPERNFLGVERLAGRVDKTARRLRARGLPNARVLRLESSYTLGWLLPSHCASRVFLLYPDPWPKKAHRKKRIINQKEFLDALERVLIPNGEFLVKSDDSDFFENTLEIMAAHPGFTKLDWPENAFSCPTTAFEGQWTALGKPLHRARWRHAR